MKNPLDRLNSRFGQAKDRIREYDNYQIRGAERKKNEKSEQNLRGRWVAIKSIHYGSLRRKENFD